MHSFSDWTLAELDRAFKLTVLDTSPVLEDWLNGPAKISSFEQQTLHSFQTLLKIHVYDWNETELAYNFLSARS
ncbi:MAG: hypothetical protein D3904_09770 [Candidatus Electrothrix sp. EH2]|nr:hypothetical protein [Candidatus Electrothrix sp. EH2]